MDIIVNAHLILIILISPLKYSVSPMRNRAHVSIGGFNFSLSISDFNFSLLLRSLTLLTPVPRTYTHNVPLKSESHVSFLHQHGLGCAVATWIDIDWAGSDWAVLDCLS